MNTLLKIALVSSSLILASAASFPVYSADMPLEQSISAAKTPADHEALAQRYEAEAKANQAKAAEHKQMASGYKNLGGKGGAEGFVSHCDKLANAYAEAAKQDEELAKLHRQFSTQLEK
ncbi:MAG: hypothetical protein HY749_01865 [Gammaproteobacteria bacterium]|nr:hypothetical protein [Gammaproteobacteria bacterium]